MASHAVPRKLWEHPDPQSTLMWKFMQDVNKKHDVSLETFQDLHRFSITRRSDFWARLLDFSDLIRAGSYRAVVDESATVDAVPPWFEGVTLNFAENVLYSRAAADPPTHRGTAGKEDGKVAVTEIREGASAAREVTWGELRRRAGRFAAAMRAYGVRRGDRVVAVAANSIDTLLVWLAAAWLGAIFTSSSTDTGVKGVLQRTAQVDPKVLFMDDAALYNGRVADLRGNMAAIVDGLRGCGAFAGVVSIPRFAEPRDVSGVPRAQTLAAFLAGAGPSPRAPPFARVGFNEPLLICYSSGTTGAPKAIVHAAGGLMLNYFKEGRLHEEQGPDTVGLQYTTTGWIMYVANVGQLLSGARAVMYDGSPFQPDVGVLVRILGEQRVTKFGTSPRWLLEVAKQGLAPREAADLSSLRTVTTTGMVLSDQLFEWFYDKGFPAHVHLANISGGTDIGGCFGLMNPLTPVYVGGTQGPSLGVDVRIYDSTLPDGPGKEVAPGTPGELVAARPFPNAPCFFWGDAGPAPAAPGTKYHAAYFARFDGVWAHGDFCSVQPATGGVAFLGRADGVLNPSGVRFGSAEIYGVVERHFADAVQDALCVGQRRPGDEDERVLLFLLMRPGRRLDAALARQVREAIRRDLSARHVPKYVFETPAIPTTVNLKKVELPVKQIVSGKTVTPSGTLANPESLDYFYQFAKVEELAGPREKL